jgi:glutamyl-tRNA synthetase
MLANGAAYKCFSTQEEIEAFREAARAEGRSTLFRSPWRDVPEAATRMALRDPREGAARRGDGDPGPRAGRRDDPERGAGRHGHAPLGRDAGLHAGRGGGRPRHGRHPCDPGRRPPEQRRAADDDLPRDGLGGAGLGAYPADPRGGRQEAVQAPRGRGLEDWQARGYPAAAMRNYLARLGWSHGDDEFFTTEQAIASGSTSTGSRRRPRGSTARSSTICRASTSRRCRTATWCGRSRRFSPQPHNPARSAQARRACAGDVLPQGPARTWPELLEKAHFVLTDRPVLPDEAAARALDPVSRGILAELTPQLQNASWTRDSLEGIVTGVAEAHGTKLGKLAPPLRAALAGRTVSPSVFDMMLVLGRDETVARIADAAA